MNPKTLQSKKTKQDQSNEKGSKKLREVGTLPELPIMDSSLGVGHFESELKMSDHIDGISDSFLDSLSAPRSPALASSISLNNEAIPSVSSGAVQSTPLTLEAAMPMEIVPEVTAASLQSSVALTTSSLPTSEVPSTPDTHSISDAALTAASSSAPDIRSSTFFQFLTSSAMTSSMTLQDYLQLTAVVATLKKIKTQPSSMATPSSSAPSVVSSQAETQDEKSRVVDYIEKLTNLNDELKREITETLKSQGAIQLPLQPVSDPFAEFTRSLINQHVLQAANRAMNIQLDFDRNLSQSLAEFDHHLEQIVRNPTPGRPATPSNVMDAIIGLYRNVPAVPAGGFPSSTRAPSSDNSSSQSGSVSQEAVMPTQPSEEGVFRKPAPRPPRP